MPENPPVQSLNDVCDQWTAEKAAYIERLVNEAPLLSNAQRDKIATMLRGAADQPLDAA